LRQRRRVAVYGICRDEAGRTLLVRGSDRHSSFPGVWHLPGGGVEHGEDPEHALVREFVEETGLDIEVGPPREIVTNLIERPERDELLHTDRILFDVRVRGGSLRAEQGGTSDQARFFGADELAGLTLTSFTTRFLGAGVPFGGEPGDPGAAVAASVPVSREGLTHVQRFAAYGLTTDPAGRYLLTRIADGYPGAGTWHLPGGGTDFGESTATALARELVEETGQVGEVGRLLSVEHFHNPAALGPERRPIDWHTVRSVFRVEVAHPTPPIVHDRGGSTDQAAWIDRSELGKLELNAFARRVISGYAP